MLRTSVEVRSEDGVLASAFDPSVDLPRTFASDPLVHEYENAEAFGQFFARQHRAVCRVEQFECHGVSAVISNEGIHLLRLENPRSLAVLQAQPHAYRLVAIVVVDINGPWPPQATVASATATSSALRRSLMVSTQTAHRVLVLRTSGH